VALGGSMATSVRMSGDEQRHGDGDSGGQVGERLRTDRLPTPRSVVARDAGGVLPAGPRRDEESDVQQAARAPLQRSRSDRDDHEGSEHVLGTKLAEDQWKTQLEPRPDASRSGRG
jgi:hypothetical protein